MGADRFVVEFAVLPLDRDSEAPRRTGRVDLAGDCGARVSDVILRLCDGPADPGDDRFLGLRLEEEHLLHPAGVDDVGVTRSQEPDQGDGEEGDPSHNSSGIY